MVLTFRAGKFAALAVCVVVVLAGLPACSREQQDWRSAEASDTVEAYSDFLKDHPDSGLVRQARARMTQLSEDRAWSQAGSVDTVEAYEQFLAQYPNGKWSQEAHIRVENFELGAAGSGASASGAAGTPGVAASNILGAAAPPGGTGSPSGPSPGASVQAPVPTSSSTSIASTGPSGPPAPGEAAQLPTSTSGAIVQSPRPSTYPVAAAAPFPSTSSVAANAANATAPVGTAAAGLAASGAAAGLTPSAFPTPSSVATAWRSADPTSYGVQLGAFASEYAATSQWQQLVERFNAQLRGLAPHVVSAETATGRLFRLQALVADEATARALCDMLKKQSQACVPVLPH